MKRSSALLENLFNARVRSLLIRTRLIFGEVNHIHLVAECPYAIQQRLTLVERGKLATFVA